MKQEYEDFFAVEETPPEAQPAASEKGEQDLTNEETKEAVKPKSKDFVSLDDF